MPQPVAAGPVGRVVEALALVLLAVLAVTIVRPRGRDPARPWDGWAIWGPRRTRSTSGGDVWATVFAEPEYVMHHQEYPVLLPALEALSAEALGRFDPT